MIVKTNGDEDDKQRIGDSADDSDCDDAPVANPLKTNKLIYWIKILLRYSYWISDALFYFCNIFIASATF